MKNKVKASRIELRLNMRIKRTRLCEFVKGVLVIVMTVTDVNLKQSGSKHKKKLNCKQTIPFRIPH